MQTVTLSTDIRKAFHATLSAQSGIAFATADRYFFASDAGDLTLLTDAHVHQLVILGDVAVAEDAYLDDLVCNPNWRAARER